MPCGRSKEKYEIMRIYFVGLCIVLLIADRPSYLKNLSLKFDNINRFCIVANTLCFNMMYILENSFDYSL